ncbi:hypothetical protein NW767_006695 [Fusarium falciforme]|nr:hypothetical protein NW767_006695 [Fusarium falciforme]
MPGLEAVAAFALACNVMQVVEVAYKTVGTCKRIYQTGQPDPALDDYSSQLRDVSNALETQLSKAVGPLSSDDSRLRDLAVQCTTIANGLLDQIASVSKSAGKKTIGSSIRLAIKSMLKQNDLNRWEKDLARSQSAMETQLLVGLRQRLDANILHSDEMGRDLKHFVRQLSNGQTSLSNLVLRQTREIKEEMSKSFTEAEASTKTHITIELLRNDNRMQSHISKAFDNVQIVAERHAQEESASRALEEFYRRLLTSLKFPEMEARRNHVSHACPETFHWILNSQDPKCDNNAGNHSEARTWDSLVEWLQSSKPVYWVSGKPASGKSTLMKFILSHDQTKPLLQKWQDNVRILSHFFWRPGTELQQSIKGLLCSLLHQIFVQDKGQVLSYLKIRRELCWKDSPSDWDPKELQALLVDCLQCPSAAFCLFIDGLDEVWPKDGVHNLVSLLKTLLQNSNHLKLCVSSRREHLLENRLRDYPQLKMHELIQNDLEKYATQALSEASAHANLDSGDIRTIINQIVWASDGVFLWTVLVSNSLSRGLRNGDSRNELFQRLDSLPRDLEGLYLDMWLRQNGDDEIYRESSAKLLYLCLVGLGWKEKPGFGLTPTVLQLMAAMDDEGPEDHLIHRRYPVEELRIRCQTTVKMIQVRSAGLLEVYDVYGMSQLDPDYEAIFDDRIRFIHRSAQDFLTDTQQGRTFWANHGMTYDSACTKLYLALTLTYLIGERFKERFWEPSSPLDTLAEHCDFLEPSTIRHCLQETAKHWHTLRGRHHMLVEASCYGFFEYASEQLSAEQNESSAVPRLFLHMTCTDGWMRFPNGIRSEAGQRHVVEGQCRLLRLFLDKVAFRDPKSFILPPVGDGGPCYSISQTLGGFLLLFRDSVDSSASAQTLMDTLGAFEGTPVDPTDKLLLNLDWVITRNREPYLKVSLFEPGATISPGTERVQVEISLCDWVDATLNNLHVLITGHRPITGNTSCAPHVRFVSLIARNTAKELCRYTPNESHVNHLSHMAQELLYAPFTLPGYSDGYANSSGKAFIGEVTSLREGWAESVLDPWI